MDISAFSTRKRGIGSVAEWADSVQDFGWSSQFGDNRIVAKVDRPNWNHGLLVDFDNTPRMGLESSYASIGGNKRGGPSSFEYGLDLNLNATLQRMKQYKQDSKMLMVVAFNEWTEQAVLEPSDQYGIGYLEAMRRSLRKVGQYRFGGRESAWKQVPRSVGGRPYVPPQITRCAPKPLL